MLGTIVRTANPGYLLCVKSLPVNSFLAWILEKSEHQSIT